MPKIAIIYYSSTGTNHKMAEAVAEGAREAGAEVRVKLVAETAPREAVEGNARWQAFVDKTRDAPRAELGDLEWADGVVFGTPTRYGNVAAQLKAFIDATGGLWTRGKLADKVYAGFTSAQAVHGGQESTLLALFHTIHHFGGILVAPGYTDPAVSEAGGNPYGPSVTVGPEGDPPTPADLAHARALGRRVARLAEKLRA